MKPAVAITIVAVLALAGAVRSEEAAPPTIGAWRIETSKNSEAQQESVALVTSAVDHDATFSLGCKTDLRLFHLVIRDPRLDLAAGSEATLSIRFPGEEPTRWQVAARGDGSVIVQEVVQQTAFTAILVSLRQATAPTVEFGIDDRHWTFRLEHFSAALQDLIAACGFPPDPGRKGAARDDAPPPGMDVQRRNQPDLRLLPPRAR